MKLRTLSFVGALTVAGGVCAQAPVTETDFAQAFAASMCQSYHQMVSDLAGLDGQQTVPDGVLRETFKEFPDLELRGLLTRTMDLIISSPSRGQRYLQGGQFQKDCFDVALRSYERSSATAPAGQYPTTNSQSKVESSSSRARSNEAPRASDNSLNQRR